MKKSKHTVTLSKDYEVYDPDKEKWGGVPKVTTAGHSPLLFYSFHMIFIETK